MKTVKKIVPCVLAFILTMSTLWLGLTLSAHIPNSALQENMLKSANYYKDKAAYEFEGASRLCNISDNYADAILLQLCMNMGEDSPIVGALDTKYYDGENYGESIGFYLSLTNDTVEPNVDYSRYWHGLAIFIRLFHLFTDVAGIKLIGFCAVMLLAAAVMFILAVRRHFDIAAAFGISLAAVQIWNVRLSLEYIPAFVVAFAMCVLFLLLERRGESALLVLSVVSGTAVAFFDFLTVETVSILLPLILVLAVRFREGRAAELTENLFFITKSGICWGSGYFAAFLSKWTLASIVTGENKFAAALSSVGERFAGGTASEGINNCFMRVFAAPTANISTLFGGTDRINFPRVLFGIVLTVMIAVSLIYLFGKKPLDKASSLPLLLLGGVVIVRFMVLNNHSYIHEFFTYRALVSPIMALICALMINIQLPKRKGYKIK